MSEILVITCPGGQQCSHLIPLLYNKGRFKLRLAAHSTASTARLRTRYPDAEVVQTDLTSPAACASLVEGSSSVYHVGPSMHSREREMGLNMVDAAAAEASRPGAGLRHFVFSSVLGSQVRSLMQHDLKSLVEERLYLTKALNWTILQPTNFMDTYPVAQLARDKTARIVRLWDADGPQNSRIALCDLAEAAARVLNEGEKHYFAQYPLASTMPLSEREVVREIGRVVGREIEMEEPPAGLEDAVDRLVGLMFGPVSAAAGGDGGVVGAPQGDPRPDLARDMIDRFMLFSRRRGLRGNPNVLRALLGREPTGVAEWAVMQLKEAGMQ